MYTQVARSVIAEILRPPNPPFWGTLKKDSNLEEGGKLVKVVFS
jgi:hypothetical protein